MWTQIAQQVSQATGIEFSVDTHRSVSGGCINQGYRLTGNGCTYFVKINQVSQVEMFAAEALGLKQILKTGAIRVPEPICWGVADRSSFIVMEWLEFSRGRCSGVGKDGTKFGSDAQSRRRFSIWLGTK